MQSRCADPVMVELVRFPRKCGNATLGPAWHQLRWPAASVLAGAKRDLFAPSMDAASAYHIYDRHQTGLRTTLAGALT